jgi:hypothetical protein
MVLAKGAVGKQIDKFQHTILIAFCEDREGIPFDCLEIHPMF